jgi:hypothetical protein
MLFKFSGDVRGEFGAVHIKIKDAGESNFPAR